MKIESVKKIWKPLQMSSIGFLLPILNRYVLKDILSLCLTPSSLLVQKSAFSVNVVLRLNFFFFLTKIFKHFGALTRVPGGEKEFKLNCTYSESAG